MYVDIRTDVWTITCIDDEVTVSGMMKRAGMVGALLICESYPTVRVASPHCASTSNSGFRPC